MTTENIQSYFLRKNRCKVKPQFPNKVILHNSDGSSCIIGFIVKGNKHTNKHAH